MKVCSAFQSKHCLCDAYFCRCLQLFQYYWIFHIAAQAPYRLARAFRWASILWHPQSPSVTLQSPYTARLHGHANAHIVEPCNCHERQLIMVTKHEKSNLWLPKFAADVCRKLSIYYVGTGSGLRPPTEIVTALHFDACHTGGTTIVTEQAVISLTPVMNLRQTHTLKPALCLHL